MSLAKINNFSNDDTDILALQTTVDALYNNSYSLTNYDNTTVPAIAAGSKIEVNGSLYRAATEEAISTTDPVTSSTVADGTVYICMIPSGDASTCTAAFTATAPTWSDSKQGWYGTSTYANYKYLDYVATKNTSSYTKKTMLYRKTRFFPFIYTRLYYSGASPQTAVAFSSTDRLDLLGECGSSSITLQHGGIYKIYTSAVFSDSSNSYSTVLCDLRIRVNGSDVQGLEYQGIATEITGSSGGGVNVGQLNSFYVGILHDGDVITVYTDLANDSGTVVVNGVLIVEQI